MAVGRCSLVIIPIVAAAVANVSASPGTARDVIAVSAGYNKVYVMFKSPGGAEPILQYYVYAYQDGVKKLTGEVYPDNNDPRNLEFAEMSPLPAGTYQFTVKARDAGGYGAETTPVSATTDSLPRGPMNIYVDPALPNTITDGSYQPVPGLSAGHGLKSIQAAIFAMNPGDDVYIKGGRYTECYSMGMCVYPHYSKNGTAAKYSGIQSYPGEWAILDAQGQSKVVLGLPGNSTSVFPSYWRIERLELTGGQGVGFYGNQGPFIIRYCYIHDNIRTGFDGSNIAGINGYVWHDSVVEYNHLKDNGYSNDDRGVVGMFIYGDYGYQYGLDADHPLNPDYCMRRNVIRYNLIEKTAGRVCGDKGIGTKANQYLTSHTEINWDHKGWGDDIHHNVFKNFANPLDQVQDFAQVHHNIFYAPEDMTLSSVGVTASQDYEATAAVVYNNTVINGVTTRSFIAPRPARYDPPSLPNPLVYHYNNLVDHAPYFSNYYAINLGYPYASETNPNYDADRTDIRHNYAYRSRADVYGRIAHLRINHSGMGSCLGAMTFSEYEACSGKANFANDSPAGADPLFEPGTYKARGQHQISGAVTIANGGIGGAHPYLEGVALPSYVGATNPIDNGWVDNVLGLATLGNLQNAAKGDAPWIEDYHPPTDVTAPSVPTGLAGAGLSVSEASLSWAPSTDAVGVAGYYIYRDGRHVGTSVALSYTDADLKAATAYIYTVAAFDAAGNASVQSSPANVTTQDYELPGTARDIVAVPSGPDKIYVLFKRPAGTDPIVQYYIYAYRNGVKERTGEIYPDAGSDRGLEFVDMGPLSAGTYQLTVKARNPRGYGQESAPVTAATLSAPRGPMNIYVDPALPNAITDGSYQPVPGLSAGHAFKSVQAAIFAMNPGDDIYVKGGRYSECYSSAVSVQIHHSKSGTASKYSSIQSYPGEWAILDAQGQSRVVMGLPGDSTILFPSYWRIERLELTGGQGVGFYGNQGPFIIRHCYIHDNLREVFDGSNIAGINGYVWHDSLVEYNYLKDNGYVNGRQGVVGMFIFGDYGFQYGLGADHPLNPDYSMRRNVIRYNLIEKTAGMRCGEKGIGTKANQYLTSHVEINWGHKTWGDDIHHNIFKNFASPLDQVQDFAQVHNNIFYSPDNMPFSSVGVTGDKDYETTAAVVYNNTVINGVMTRSFVAPHRINDPASLESPVTYHYNNVIDHSPYFSNSYPINLGYPYAAETNPSYSAERTDIRNNYAYRTRGNGGARIPHIRINHAGMGACFGAMTFPEYQACSGKVNFANDSPGGADPLFEPGTYKTRGQHQISGAVTIANGGIGGDHPYLEGVTMPSYIGATNPNDNLWVDGVLGLANTEYLTNAGAGEPSWIEGRAVLKIPRAPRHLEVR